MERHRTERSSKMASRSKSHDVGEERRTSEKGRSQRRQGEERRGSGEHPSERLESHQAPFYLHSSSSQISSHYGYERIQSLFYGSTEQIQQDNANLKTGSSGKASSRERGEARPRKSRESSRTSNNKDNSDICNDSNDPRQRSPRRRAAPAMPLPPAPPGPGRVSEVDSVQSVICVPPCLVCNDIPVYGDHQYEAIPVEAVQETSQGEHPPSSLLVSLSRCHVSRVTPHSQPDNVWCLVSVQP